MQLLVAIVATLAPVITVPELCDLAHSWLATHPEETQALLRDMRSNDWTTVADTSRIISLSYGAMQTEGEDER